MCGLSYTHHPSNTNQLLYVFHGNLILSFFHPPFDQTICNLRDSAIPHSQIYTDFTRFLTSATIFEFYMVSRMPGRHLEMILGLVAPFSQSMSSFRATATHFVPKTMNFVRPQSLKHINGTYKILILDHVCIANTKSMYCKYKNMV